MAYTFDGSTKRITLSAGTVTLELVDLHSRWKDWVIASNASDLIAFGTVGGDIPSIPLYLFLQNGWKIVPQAADHTLTVTGGILETSDGSDPFVDPVGAYKIRINRQTPGIAIGYSTSGVAAPTAMENAAAILAAAQVTPIHSNVKQMNSATVQGTGTAGDQWRGSGV
jgi:hypothetical protein